MSKRYFVVFYEVMETSEEYGHDQQFGKFYLTTSGSYPNEKRMMDLISERTGLENPFITHIYEMDEDDFDDFVEGSPFMNHAEDIDDQTDDFL